MTSWNIWKTIVQPYKSKSMAAKKNSEKNTNDKRPADYTPQPGNKATLTLADFSDENLFAELRRRGYSGELRYTQICRV